MRTRKVFLFAAAALVVAGCSTDLPTDAGLLGVEDRVLFTEHGGDLAVSVCKSWGEVDEPTPDIGWTFSFTATAAPAAGEVTVYLDPDAGENGRFRCEPLGSWPAGTEVTVAEQVPPGFELDFIGFFLRTGGDEFGPSVDLATASTTFDVVDVDAVVFKNVIGETPPPPPPGLDGCTPGFWRQAHHYPYWTGAAPTDAWTAHFANPGSHQAPGRNGATFNGSTSLGAAVQLNGGGIFALARHAVAALLNANSADVNYPLSSAEVVALVNAALASGNFEGAKDTLEGYNELGCTVDKSGLN